MGFDGKCFANIFNLSSFISGGHLVKFFACQLDLLFALGLFKKIIKKTTSTNIHWFELE
jgi:hypothetical protein